MYEIFESLLEKNNVTAYKVGKETGIASSTFTDWKMGRSIPKAEKLQRIADYFSVTVGYLMGRNDETTNETKISDKERLNSLITEHPLNSIKLLSKLCKKTRIEKDITEKVVATNAGIDLDTYLSFEDEAFNIGVDKIVNVLLYFELNIAFITGYITAIVIEMKENETETDKLLNRLLIDEDFKDNVLKKLKIKTLGMEEANKNNQILIQDGDVIDNLAKALNAFSFKHNENDN